MVELSATVQNANGIHCRPSAVIVKAAQEYAGVIEVLAEAGTTDLRSVIGLICLGLESGKRITIRVTGPDEAAFCKRLAELFETHFDFPARGGA